MKNKSDWFDDNWNWDVQPTQVLYELLLSPTYRIPMRVKEVYTPSVRSKYTTLQYSFR